MKNHSNIVESMKKHPLATASAISSIFLGVAFLLWHCIGDGSAPSPSTVGIAPSPSSTGSASSRSDLPSDVDLEVQKRYQAAQAIRKLNQQSQARQQLLRDGKIEATRESKVISCNEYDQSEDEHQSIFDDVDEGYWSDRDCPEITEKDGSDSDSDTDSDDPSSSMNTARFTHGAYYNTPNNQMNDTTTLQENRALDVSHIPEYSDSSDTTSVNSDDTDSDQRLGAS